MSGWMGPEGDATFRRECAKGIWWETYVTCFLKQQGLSALLSPKTIREDVALRHEHRDGGDLVVESLLAEIKSRDVVFHTPDDFPHNAPFVMTVGDWGQKPRPPSLVICVSQRTSAMMWIPTCTRPWWSQAERFDNVRRMQDVFYEADRRLWRPIETLPPLLREAAGDADRFDRLARPERLPGQPFADPSIAELFT